jgi:hypothetical protein
LVFFFPFFFFLPPFLLAFFADHSTIELFKKKKIRCDCGTGELSSCKFEKRERNINEDNNYVPAHNYQGLFCWCKQTYDPESDLMMLQCSICTDWFHENCILKEWNSEAKHLEDEMVDHALFICKECSPLLNGYENLKFQKNKTQNQISEEANINLNRTICPILNESFKAESAFFRGDLEDFLCKWEICQSKFDNLLIAADESESEGGDVENVRMKTSIENAIDSLPHSQQFQLTSGYSQFKAVALEIINQKYNSGKRVIDVDDVEEIKAEMHKRLKK